jgi:hypothetical protein
MGGKTPLGKSLGGGFSEQQLFVFNGIIPRA